MRWCAPRPAALLRAWQSGISDDIRILRDIEQYYSTQIDEMVRPALLRCPGLGNQGLGALPNIDQHCSMQR